MATWLIRATKEVHDSGSPAAMENRYGGSFRDGAGLAITNPTAIYRPDLGAVTGWPSRYWIVGVYPDDSVTLMDEPTRDALDAALLAAARDALAAQLDNTEDIGRAFMLVVLDELNRHAQEQTALLAQIAAATSLADLKTRVAANVQAIGQRTGQQLRDAVRGKLGS